MINDDDYGDSYDLYWLLGGLWWIMWGRPGFFYLMCMFLADLLLSVEHCKNMLETVVLFI